MFTTVDLALGASSYLILRPEGNILIDSPRFHPFIVRKLEELGTARFQWC